jgi:hypothetical protein
MAIRTQSWYDLNCSRAYPLDDAASAVDDQGIRLPSHFIADLNLKFPSTAGQYVYLSGITVTERLVTLVFLATNDLDDASACVPLAAVTVEKPVTCFRQYAVDALYPGVGGWVVFGHGVDDEPQYSARFSTSQQSLFTRRAVHIYTPLPIPSMGRLNNATALTGLIYLLGGDDIEIVKECRTIPDAPARVGDECDDATEESVGRECIVIRLIAGASSEIVNPVANLNVYGKYAGDCDNVAESHACGEDEPIQFIGPVQPDCCGNITIKFRGCASISEIVEAATLDEHGSLSEVASATGVIVDCGLSLVDACVSKDQLPSPDGELPNEYYDLCESASFSDSLSITFPLDESFSFTYPAEFPEESEAWYTFEDEFETYDALWQVKAGCFGYVEGHRGADSLSLSDMEGELEWAMSTVFTNSALGTNLVRCAHPNVLHVFRRKVSAILEIYQGGPGCWHNASVAAAIRPVHEDVFTCLIAELDWDGFNLGYKSFRIAYWNGAAWSTLASAAVPTMGLDKAYYVSLSLYPCTDTTAWVIATLTGMDDGISVSLGPTLITDFSNTDFGYPGLYTKRSKANFYWFGYRPV